MKNEKLIKNKAEFMKLVLFEIEGLKTHATQEQKDALDLSRLNPQSSFTCIYGQMTGNCNSDAAFVLAKKCGIEITINGPTDDSELDIPNLQRLAMKEPKKYMYFTPMEMYIYTRPNDAARIAIYIKDLSDKLVLTDK